MDITKEPPVILSICTGMRGIERGLERIFGTLNVAAYVEIEAFIIENLVRQMEQGFVDPAPVWTNVETFPSQSFYGKLHGIVGGYPCPGESLAGLRELHKYHGFLWPHIRRIIDKTRPVFCFFENVAAHLSGTYPIVYRSLRKMGYAVEAGIYTAQEIGAPHERERLFILAILGNTNITQFQRCINTWRRFSKSSNTGSIMANANSSNTGRNIADILCTPETIKRTSQRKNGQRLWNELEYSNKALGQWPAPPGRYQHDWEKPRSVESGVGCTVDGYNFRVDLLRMLGNGVVEQTAEKAFIELLNKF